MNPTSFETVRGQPGRSPAEIAAAVTGEPARVRVRALTGNLFLSTEVAALAGRTPAELAGLSEVFVIPLGRVDDIVLAPGDKLYAVCDGPPFQVPVHQAPVLGEQIGGVNQPELRTQRKVVRRQIREICEAPNQAPIRVVIRSHGDLNENIEVGELMDLKTAGGGYVIPGSVGGITKESFVLAPGQVLWAVARTAVPVAISVSRHAGLTDGTVVVM